MHEISVTWSDYHRKVEELIVKVHESGWEFNQIVCIAKGGLRVGDIFARVYRVPLAILAASSYTNDRQRTSLTFSRDLAMTTANLGSRVLLVDDLADSGSTLRRGIEWLKYHYGFYIDELRTAVIWHKAISTVAPDYCVDYLPDNPWIHQPFEPYEHVSPEQLAQTLRNVG